MRKAWASFVAAMALALLLSPGIAFADNSADTFPPDTVDTAATEKTTDMASSEAAEEVADLRIGEATEDAVEEAAHLGSEANEEPVEEPADSGSVANVDPAEEPASTAESADALQVTNVVSEESTVELVQVAQATQQTQPAQPAQPVQPAELTQADQPVRQVLAPLAASNTQAPLAASKAQTPLAISNAQTRQEQQESANKMPIEQGEYIIVRADSESMVLDAAGGGTKNGTNVQLYTANGTAAQLWIVTSDKDGYYTFINKKSGKALDVAGASAKNTTNIWLYQSNGTKAQKWKIVPSGTGYMFQSALNKTFVLDAAGNGKANGTNIHLYKNNATPAQFFSFINTNIKVESAGQTLENGVYVVETAAAANQMIDVAGGSAENGANVQVYQANNSTAQRWNVVYGADGFYTITSVESGLALDVAGGMKTPNANVHQYASNGTDAQKWSIQHNDDGSYSLISKCNGLALAVGNAKATSGTNVCMGRPDTQKTKKFSFESVPVLADGTYMFYSKLAPTSKVVDIAGNSVQNNAYAHLYDVNATPAQRFVLTHLSDNTYTIQSVASGKYVTDKGGAVVQHGSINNEVADSQKWKIAVQGNGIVATNVASGKVMAIAGGKARNGAKMQTQKHTGAQAQKFRPVRYSSLLVQGLYNIKSSAASTMLDVVNGSWDSGANVQVYKPNGANAQKFAVIPLGGDEYRIVLALGGTVVESKSATKNTSSNVRMGKNVGAANQIWQAKLTDAGIMFTNKATGRVLTSSENGKSATNVAAQAIAGTPAQAWQLSATKVSTTDLASLSLMAARVGSGAPVLNANGRNYAISAGAHRQLMDALSEAWDRGSDVGLVLIDPKTGVSLAVNADTTIHGASTFKAAYVTYLFQDLVEKGSLNYNEIAGLAEQTIVYSNNYTYQLLRNRFGNSGFQKWLNQIGLGSMAPEWYPRMTARELASIWGKLYSYEQSGGNYVNKWRSIFSHSDYSAFYEQLGGFATTYSKSGWYPQSAGYASLCDGAIVRHKDGSTYIASLLSTVDCNTERWITRGIVNAIDRVYAEMPKF